LVNYLDKYTEMHGQQNVKTRIQVILSYSIANGEAYFKAAKDTVWYVLKFRLFSLKLTLLILYFLSYDEQFSR